ncbi:MAG TPA: hypothetical protein VFV95_11860 [Vicinamibacterales bacterium]|nr:hypothetical protein [Vicinamibacterales bacterium]
MHSPQHVEVARRSLAVMPRPAALPACWHRVSPADHGLTINDLLQTMTH